MDLKKLVNSDVSTQQTESRATTSSTQHYAQPPVGQAAYAAHDQRAYGYAQPERQASFERPPEHGVRPPTLTPAGSQYFQHPSQSPATYQPPQQPSPYSVRSGQGSRPSSHGHERYPATPLQLHPPSGPLTQPPALSPTPSSQRSHTPQSVHHSPMPALQYGLSPSATQQQYPAAAFGPPALPLSQSRIPSQYHDNYQSPQQQRISLGPPQHRMSMDHIAGSPATHLAQSPAARSTSIQRSQSEREHSISVSPKSFPKPPPSLGSAQSSMQEEVHAYQNGPPQDWSSQRQVNITHQQSASHSRRTSLTNTSTYQPSIASPVSVQQSSTATAPTERPVVRRSATMEMSHLLAEDPPMVKQEKTENIQAKANGVIDSTESKKRAPDEDISSRPHKKERTNRQLERPIWAMLSPRNPRHSGGAVQRITSNTKTAAVPNGRPHNIQRPVPANGVSAPTKTTIDVDRPWLNPLPYDMDLIVARDVLGPWEKSIKWNTPYPDMLRAVQDWLVHNLQQHQDIVQDPSTGSIEIEAKIGRLVKPATGQRAGLPVMNMTLLDPAVNRDYRFESELEETDFKILNAFLNTSLLESRQGGRRPMEYKRVLEIDSFEHLSSAGLVLLPKSLHKQASHGRELKLRSTQDVKSSQIIARIIKVPIADLHIYNPSGYDCRISMNAEVNLMRPDVHHEDLVIPPTEDKPLPPSRRKDRLTYRHLAYQIDLTNVQVSGLAAKYEMEIEVAAQALSTQIQLMVNRQPHAFGDVVAGFLDNATFLMRQQQPSK